jgi:hypothetical protein
MRYSTISSPPLKEALNRTVIGSVQLTLRLCCRHIDRIGPGQRCCWPLKADPSAGARPAYSNRRAMFRFGNIRADR